MVDILDGISVLKDAFNGVSFMGIAWLFSVVVIIISLVLITRSLTRWKVLALPVSIMWANIGLNVPMFVILPLGVIFVIEGISTNVFGNLLSGSAKQIRSMWHEPTKTEIEYKKTMKLDNMRKQQNKIVNVKEIGKGMKTLKFKSEDEFNRYLKSLDKIKNNKEKEQKNIIKSVRDERKRGYIEKDKELKDKYERNFIEYINKKAMPKIADESSMYDVFELDKKKRLKKK